MYERSGGGLKTDKLQSTSWLTLKRTTKFKDNAYVVESKEKTSTSRSPNNTVLLSLLVFNHRLYILKR